MQKIVDETEHIQQRLGVNFRQPLAKVPRSHGKKPAVLAVYDSILVMDNLRIIPTSFEAYFVIDLMFRAQRLTHLFLTRRFNRAPLFTL